MEETLEGGRGPPRAVAPLERERECSYKTDSVGWLKLHCHKNTNIRNFNSVANKRDMLNQVKKTELKMYVLFIKRRGTELKCIKGFDGST